MFIIQEVLGLIYVIVDFFPSVPKSVPLCGLACGVVQTP